VLGLLFALEQSQWLDPAALRARQDEQIQRVLAHAVATVPHYRRAYRGLFDPARPPGADAFAALPILSHREAREGFDELASERPPAAHGRVELRRTSGSLSAPMRYLATGLVQLHWQAITLRDHRWHARDLEAATAVIRGGVPDGESAGWGPTIEGLFSSGPLFTHDIRHDAGAQLEWLRRKQPAYLLAPPSLLAELARLSLARGVALPGLRHVRSLGEALRPEWREACRRAWGVPLVDMYSASEVGYLALQCPEHEHYHVQSESALLEVLRDDGSPCAPGETGRVVVTTLHNFAMPYVRYAIGDYAEVGAPCACGRGLPVLARVAGRSRNLLRAPDGRRYWPALGIPLYERFGSIRQAQFVQRDLSEVEVRLVADAPLASDRERALLAFLAERMPYGLRFAIRYVERLERTAGGKLEDFVCEVAE
jgi:phenylacetate-CoA ligase